MQFIIKELNQLKQNSNIDEGELDKEVAELPKNGLMILSLSKNKLIHQHQKIKDSQQEKNNYIKKLENEIVNQRIALEDIKKAENEHLLKISAYEDQIRILKSKVFGYDIAKKYEYYKQHESTNNNQNAHLQDDNLAFSMWENENEENKKEEMDIEKKEENNEENKEQNKEEEDNKEDKENKEKNENEKNEEKKEENETNMEKEEKKEEK